MTEAEWLACEDAEEMYFQVAKLPWGSPRRLDHFCVACASLVLSLIEDEDARRPFEWLEEHPGQRPRPDGGAHVRELFRGPARALYDAHHRREQGISGAAIHVAYDFWADWYEYAFPNLGEYFTDSNAPYRGALRDNPRTFLPIAIRDIFGNPFRPVAFSPSWRTSTAVALASQMYESREFSAMPILADALQDAGCDSADVLSHCRAAGAPHVRGCWVVDLVLGKT
ncbi:hypothetical protein [Gemmata palustris]|uniref:hypothetical protein n=1 Tax=Gemmata palustris TaxID=2822762 RepID=UPI001FE5F188|nr:hypothetical protein [Gemmata palustris]